MTKEEARKQVCEAGLKLLKEGLVARTWGNVSVRIDDRFCAITPSGKAYEEMTPGDIVIMDYTTGEYEGDVKPSSEKGVHAGLYKTRKDINAIIHTHQVNASTIAAAHRVMPAVLDDMAQLIGPDVKIAKYALPSTIKLVKETLKAMKGRNACILANHGAVCAAPTMDDCFAVAQILEKSCKVFIEAEFLGGAKKLSKFDAVLMRQFYLRKYAKRK
ncbi:MAG: class II aldolase/adducin family protein [Spirochaetales bacterium]|nr:class II aldolase/adducin family protein [Spirochaetales bacterium]